MFFYKVGYHSLEESDYIILQHRDMFLEKQLREIIFEAIKKAYWEEKRKIAVTKDYSNIYLDDIFCSDIFKEALFDCGFEEIEFTAIWDEFGWGEMEEPNIWECNRSSEYINLLERLKNE